MIVIQRRMKKKTVQSCHLLPWLDVSLMEELPSTSTKLVRGDETYENLPCLYNRNEVECMQYNEFIEQVQKRAHLSSQIEAHGVISRGKQT